MAKDLGSDLRQRRAAQQAVADPPVRRVRKKAGSDIVHRSSIYPDDPTHRKWKVLSATAGPTMSSIACAALELVMDDPKLQAQVLQRASAIDEVRRPRL